jgi:shikimate dehydrogenase
MRAGLIAGADVLSFSPLYFRREWGVGYEQLAPPTLDDLPKLVAERAWRGFNVTTPYKEAVLKLVHHQHHPVDKIHAANTIVVEIDGSWTAYNTDYEAALELLSLYAEVHGAWDEVGVLGTGGAARAVAWAHAELFPHKPIYFFSRTPGKVIPFPHPHQVLGYEAALKGAFSGQRKLIIQATPVGAYPGVQALPPVPLEAIQPQDIVWDLIYIINPTRFLQEARKKGCIIESGMRLFRVQAQKSLDHWFLVHKRYHRSLAGKA